MSKEIEEFLKDKLGVPSNWDKYDYETYRYSFNDLLEYIYQYTQSKLSELEKKNNELLKSHSEWMCIALERKDEINELERENERLRDYVDLVYKSVIGGGEVVTFSERDIKIMEKLLKNFKQH